MGNPAPALIEEPPEFEFRSGLFYVTDCSGVRVFLPAIFFQTFHGAAQVMQDYHARAEATVITVDFTSKFERVYPKDKGA
jgi:hypothetical protein